MSPSGPHLSLIFYALLLQLFCSARLFPPPEQQPKRPKGKKCWESGVDGLGRAGGAAAAGGEGRVQCVIPGLRPSLLCSALLSAAEEGSEVKRVQETGAETGEPPKPKKRRRKATWPNETEQILRSTIVLAPRCRWRFEVGRGGQEAKRTREEGGGCKTAKPLRRSLPCPFCAVHGRGAWSAGAKP